MSNAPEYNDEKHRYRLAYTIGVAARFGHKSSLEYIGEADGAVDDEILLGIYEGASLLPPRLGENVFDPPPASPRRVAVAHSGRGRRGIRERHREHRERQREASRAPSEPSRAEKEAKFNRDVELAEVVRQVASIRGRHPDVFANEKIAKAFNAAVVAVTNVFEEAR